LPAFGRQKIAHLQEDMSMSSRQSALIRQIVAMAVVAGVCLLIAISYAKLIEPAAAREVEAACRGLRPSPDNPAFGSMPSQAPVDFTAQDHQGNMVRLSDYRGKFVFVNFWATWCGVCKAEKPNLEDMADELESDDFVVLTLASDPSWDKIREYFPRGSPLKVLLDPPASDDDNLGAIARSYGITAVPESFVIDRKGHIRHYFINKRDWHSDVAKTCLRSLLEE
jgi:peroxiredoxin